MVGDEVVDSNRLLGRALRPQERGGGENDCKARKKGGFSRHNCQCARCVSEAGRAARGVTFTLIAVLMFLLLAAAAFAAGAINSIAGGGSFLTFPSLVFAGVPAVVANASSTVALFPGSLASAVSYRSDIRALEEKQMKTWLIVSLIGGAIGAVLLLVTSDRTFRQIAPWLLLFATLLFAFGTRVSMALRGKLHSSQALMVALLFPVSIYGGYFGGGMGIIILAAFRVYGLTNIHGMNGIKIVLGGSLNAIASVIFVAAHQVYWRPALLMMAAAICGGYVGPVAARRMPPVVIRGVVIAVGVLMTIYFFRIAPR
jgi:uncharacterized membrane protein YfcA